MAEIKAPKRTTKGTPPPERKASDNLRKQAAFEKAYLNFTTNPEFKREFKIYALTHDMPMNKLLEVCFYAYKENRS
jgi:hypothetical protein